MLHFMLLLAAIHFAQVNSLSHRDDKLMLFKSQQIFGNEEMGTISIKQNTLQVTALLRVVLFLSDSQVV